MKKVNRKDLYTGVDECELFARVGNGLQHIQTHGLFEDPNFLKKVKSSKNLLDSLRVLRVRSRKKAIELGFQGETIAETRFLEEYWRTILASVNLISRVVGNSRSVR